MSEPWTEIVGTIESVADDKVTIDCLRRVTVKADGSTLAKLIHLLQPGMCVGILILEDGTVTVRQFNSENGPKRLAEPEKDERRSPKAKLRVSASLRRRRLTR
jgi:hypothetical protein